MNATEKILNYLETSTESFTAKDVADATGVTAPQVRTILLALTERGDIEKVALRRTLSRGRPANAFVVAKKVA